MELIAEPRIEWSRIARPNRREDGIQHWIQAALAAEHQVLVERRLLRTRVGEAQYRRSFFKVVADAHPRLRLSLDAQSVVEISANPQVEQPRPSRNLVFTVEPELLHIGPPVVAVVIASARQVIGPQHGVVSRAARHVQIRIDDADLEVLAKKRLLIHPADLDVVHALRIGQVRVYACIGERALLRHALLLNRPEVRQRSAREGIAAGIVVEAVATHIGPEVEDHRVADRVRIARRQVDRLNLGALVGRSLCRSVLNETDLSVVSIGRLKPRPGVLHIGLQ